MLATDIGDIALDKEEMLPAYDKNAKILKAMTYLENKLKPL